jgi:hypothetical protein
MAALAAAVVEVQEIPAQLALVTLADILPSKDMAVALSQVAEMVLAVVVVLALSVLMEHQQYRALVAQARLLVLQGQALHAQVVAVEAVSLL